MSAAAPVAAVTGASGYLGSCICATLESQGWRVARLVRSPTLGQMADAYDLGAPVSTEVKAVLRSADVLVHAAYDLSLTNPVDIRRVNVDGTRRLLDLAVDAHVRRVIVISSMSAFEGTRQLYGRAKLAIEDITAAAGGCSVRPGLVYGERSGGMAAALGRLTRLPIVPVIGGAALYTVREDDLMTAVAALAALGTVPPSVVSVTDPNPVKLADLLRTLAAAQGRRRRYVPIPWQAVYALLRAGEAIHLSLPFRADSLVGLVHPAPSVSGVEAVKELGLTVGAFKYEPAGRW